MYFHRYYISHPGVGNIASMLYARICFTKHTLCTLLWSRVVSCLSAETFRQVSRVSSEFFSAATTCELTTHTCTSQYSRRMGVAYARGYISIERGEHDLRTCQYPWCRRVRVKADIWCVTNTARLNCISTCCSHSVI